MEDLENVLNGQESEGVKTEEVAAPEVKPEEVKTEEVATPEESQPPEDKTEKTVPLSALESVRKERTDWKERALKAEGRAEAFERQVQPQTQEEYVEPDPIQMIQNVILQERFNTSRIIAERDHADLHEKVDYFLEATKDNPYAQQQAISQPHPWEWIHKQASAMMIANEIGSDPKAYEEKLRQKIIAEMQQQPAQIQKPSIPQTLAGGRSAAPRSAAVFTGSTPLDSILKI